MSDVAEELADKIRPTLRRQVQEALSENALHYDAEAIIKATGLRLCGYLCPECHTWAEDMTPHCFNEHADDPVETIPFYLDDRKAV